MAASHDSPLASYRVCKNVNKLLGDNFRCFDAFLCIIIIEAVVKEGRKKICSLGIGGGVFQFFVLEMKNKIIG